MESVPLHKLLGVEPESTTSFHSNIPTVTNSSTAVRHTNDDQQPITPPSSPSSLSSSPTSSNQDTLVTIIPLAVINRILATITVQHEPITDGATDRDGIREPVTDEMIYLLLLATLESVSTRRSTSAATQVGSILHLLTGLTTLFEEVVALWLKLHNQSGDQSDVSSSGESSIESSGISIHVDPSTEHVSSSYYQGLVHVARTVLRLWVVLTSEVLQSNITPQQAAEIKPLLSAPVLTISKACYNLRHVGLFCGNECLDHEFTLMILECVLSCLHGANLLALVMSCPGEDVVAVFSECLSDGCHEWFTYLCSKLHALTEAGGGTDVDNRTSNWGCVMDTSYSLLAVILRELIQTAEHVKLFQKASKSALSGEVVHRPITYTVGLSRDFDKLKSRMSKQANIVLNCFKQVSMLQLLSLQLLSETASDTVEIISNFLSSILDPTIRTNPEVLDHYLELLENVWFRLSPDYSGSAPLWKKLTNYFTLLQDVGRSTLHQVLYHLQCLFSHDSTMLKSQLTVHVVLPLHVYIITQVREKVYDNQISSGDRSGHIGRADVEWNEGIQNALNENEQILITQYLKLLLKVASHPSSLQSFLTDTSHLYSLFLLLPVPSFCSPTLAVAEQCLKTLQKSSTTTNSNFSPTSLGDSTQQERSNNASTQKTLLKIFIKIGFSMPVDKIMNLCLAIADGKLSLPTFGLGEVDSVHKRLQDIFESAPLNNLLTPSFLNHLSIICNVWEILTRLAPCGPLVQAVLRDNFVWDIVSDFSPILGTLLTRIRQQIEGHALEAGDVAVCTLQELAVGLLASLIIMAHFICWQRQDSKVCKIYVLICICATKLYYFMQFYAFACTCVIRPLPAELPR